MIYTLFCLIIGFGQQPVHSWQFVMESEEWRPDPDVFIVFGIFKKDDKVYTEIVPDASKASLIKVIRGHVSVESVIHTDGWRSYNGLVDVGYSKHLRVRHWHNEFANGNRHINGIESFWSYAKRRLVKFNGVYRHTFLLHLKETEFRFNHRSQNLYKILLTMLRKQPLS